MKQRERKRSPQTHLPTSQLKRRHALPPLRDGLARVVADREAQRRHALHAGRAVAAVRLRVRVVGDAGRVDAVREAQDGLHVRAARRARERRARARRAVLGPVAVAPPGDHRGLLVWGRRRGTLLVVGGVYYFLQKELTGGLKAKRGEKR